jgi:hypothetical protein
VDKSLDEVAETPDQRASHQHVEPVELPSPAILFARARADQFADAVLVSPVMRIVAMGFRALALSLVVFAQVSVVLENLV